VHRTGRSYAPQGKRVKDQTFAFDRVFDDTTSQADIYESTAKPLLDNVLDGYNATVFAYGATGCGKTHTITCVLRCNWNKMERLLTVVQRSAERPRNHFPDHAGAVRED
jgi:hypothetical protein